MEHAPGSDRQARWAADVSNEDNPYKAPGADLADPDRPAAVPSEDEIRAFAGEGPAGYERYYLARLGRIRDGKAPGFNGAAFLFGTNWCFWRKLYLIGSLLLVAEFAASVALGFVLFMVAGPEFVESPAFGPLALLGPSILVRVPFGFVANGHYLRRAAKEAHQARQTGAKPETVLVALEGRGGTSGFGLALALAISFAIRMLDAAAA